jgi:membrane-bound lytic murein transglycosylase B
MSARIFAALAFSLLLIAPAAAAKCGGQFENFVAEFRREAAAKGVPARVLAEAFDDIEYDPKVMAFDRRQRNTFKRSWEDYARTRVTPARTGHGDLDHGDRQRRRHRQAAGGEDAHDARA